MNRRMSPNKAPMQTQGSSSGPRAERSKSQEDAPHPAKPQPPIANAFGKVRKTLGKPSVLKIQSELRNRGTVSGALHSQPVVVPRLEVTTINPDLSPDVSSAGEEEADIIEMLFTQYLQEKLSAQVVEYQLQSFKKKVPSSIAEDTGMVLVQRHQLKQEILVYMEILNYLKEIEEIHDIEAAINRITMNLTDPKLTKFLLDFERELSKTLDRIKTSAPGCEITELSLDGLQAAQDELMSKGEGSDLGFRILSDCVASGFDVAKLFKRFSNDEKEVTALMRKLASLKLCKEMLSKNQC